MTITATMRRCPACHELLDVETQCPRCERVLAPAVAEWPAGAKRLLCLFVVADALATLTTATEQQRMEWLMENTMRGRYFGGQLIPYSASAGECFPHFTRLLARWHAEGSPTDFAAIARLRGAH